MNPTPAGNRPEYPAQRAAPAKSRIPAGAEVRA